MNDWGGLILVLIVIIIVWWLITRFAKQGPDEFRINHSTEGAHPEQTRSVEIPAQEIQLKEVNEEQAHLEVPEALPDEVKAGEAHPEVPEVLPEKVKVGEAHLEVPDVLLQAPEVVEQGYEIPERAPAVESAKFPSVPDDLTILEGIGPKVNQLLQAHGISTFAQLSQTPADVVYTILKENGLRFMDPATWPKQARLAAEGKMDELQALMDNLKGGRRA